MTVTYYSIFGLFGKIEFNSCVAFWQKDDATVKFDNIKEFLGAFFLMTSTKADDFDNQLYSNCLHGTGFSNTIEIHFIQVGKNKAGELTKNLIRECAELY